MRHLRLCSPSVSYLSRLIWSGPTALLCRQLSIFSHLFCPIFLYLFMLWSRVWQWVYLCSQTSVLARGGLVCGCVSVKGTPDAWNGSPFSNLLFNLFRCLYKRSIIFMWTDLNNETNSRGEFQAVAKRIPNSYFPSIGCWSERSSPACWLPDCFIHLESVWMLSSPLGRETFSTAVRKISSKYSVTSHLVLLKFLASWPSIQSCGSALHKGGLPNVRAVVGAWLQSLWQTRELVKAIPHSFLDSPFLFSVLWSAPSISWHFAQEISRFSMKYMSGDHGLSLSMTSVS